MEQIIQLLFQLMKKLSYLGVIFALSCEIIPAEIVLPMAGFWVYEGEMLFWLAVIAGTIGGTIGPLLLYCVGRFGGRPFLLKYGKFILMNEKQIKQVDYFFQRFGGGAAFLGRFIPGVRTFIPIPCGMAKMNIFLFVFFTSLATAPITFFYIWLGFRYGPQWSVVTSMISEYLYPLMVGVLLLVIAVTCVRYLLKDALTKYHKY